MTIQQTTPNTDLSSQTTIMTITLDQTRNVRLNILPAESTGFQPQVWELIGMLETSLQLLKKSYLKSE